MSKFVCIFEEDIDNYKILTMAGNEKSVNDLVNKDTGENLNLFLIM